MHPGSVVLFVAKDTGKGYWCTKDYSAGNYGLFNGFTNIKFSLFSFYEKLLLAKLI
jgi:hypothetical protein